MSYLKPGMIVRSRNGGSISEGELRAAVPAIFAEHQHESRSSRYAYIPTSLIIEGLVREGYDLVEARQGRSRVIGKEPFTRHMLRFRHSTLDLRVGDTTAEIVFINSHDGTSRYKLIAGLFKMLCTNGLIAPGGPTSEYSITHTGDIMHQVAEGSKIVLQHSNDILEKPRQWSQIQLNDQQRMAFAEAARVVRFGDKDGKVETPVTPYQLLAPRRPQDSNHDLWSTFNVVQENAIKGGIYNQGTQPDGSVRRSTSRSVRGISEDLRLNRALWILADRLAKAA